MKIKVKKMPLEEVLKLPKAKKRKPTKPNILFRALIRILAIPDLFATKFKYTTYRMDEVGNSPCMILMNHSSFIDLKIASKILFPKPYCIVCTSDGFVGKDWLMRQIGCIPTQKFVTDFSLISDINYALKELKTSVLMYPEASYSFDGTATALPRKLGFLLKKANVPLVTIITKGAFSRDPLYNCLQLRKVNVSAEVKCLLTVDEIKEKSIEEIDEILDNEFSFDAFKWQQDNNIIIDEPFRADGLNRILYKCPECLTEGKMIGKGTNIKCERCGKEYHLNTLGKLESLSGENKFPHIPDWYAWERECVKKELIDGTYSLDVAVKIGALVNHKAIYMVGEGRLVHNCDGFHLTGCDGKLDYIQSASACYGLYSDYYWYEIGDVICIGNKDILYYCFPQNCGDIVAKTRMAAEELYKLTKKKKSNK